MVTAWIAQWRDVRSSGIAAAKAFPNQRAESHEKLPQADKNRCPIRSSRDSTSHGNSPDDYKVLPRRIFKEELIDG
jgi:hypothetical protein